MSQHLGDQLDKIFALLDSNHEGEALGAMRMLGRILEREALNFSDLAHAARKGNFSLARSFFSPSQVQLEAKVEQMHEDLRAHVEQNESLTTQLEFWRRRSGELEQLLNLNKAEAERWKEIARQTADRLWDMGQLTQAEAFSSDEPLPEDDEIVKEEPLKETG
ncbi:MAG TPA: hypothetical protein DD400_01340 [Rhodospirillaceae bacterium]|nr:hypothetical protein [Rhodospirillaceae bacterium]